MTRLGLVVVLASALAGCQSDKAAAGETRPPLGKERGDCKANKVCDKGLWGWSRHPIYVFEWLGWVAYPVIAISLDPYWWPGWLALIGPVLMYWLLVHVSGIPPLEIHMLKSRGQAFKDAVARLRKNRA